MLKLHFFEQIYFFHQKWFFSNGECNPDNGSKYFSLRVHTSAAQIPKTTKKNFELFERKITFPKMFLCTCRMQLWQPCQKFFVKTPNTLCSNSGNDGKKSNFPKNLFFLKMFVWTCTKRFWQDCRNHACKSTKHLFRSKSENDSNAKFSKRSNFSFISLLQEMKKNFIWARRRHLWPACPKILVKFLKTVCSNSGNEEKFGRFPIKVVSPQNVRLTCTMRFWQAWRNFVPKNTKNFPELQKCWRYIFLNKFIFFIKNASLATENAILTTVANTFLWESTHLQLRFRKPRKKTLNFSEGKKLS